MFAIAPDKTKASFIIRTIIVLILIGLGFRYFNEKENSVRKEPVKTSSSVQFLQPPKNETFKKASATKSFSDSCTTREELVSTIRKAAEKKPSTITFSYSSLLSSKIKDQDWMSEVVYDSGIRTCSWTYDTSPGSGSCTIKEITYMDAKECKTQADVVKHLKAAEDGTVSLHLDRELYKKLVKDDYALLYDLAGRAGKYGLSLTSWGDELCLIDFEKLESIDNFHTAKTEKEFVALLNKTKDEDISIYCGSEFYQKLTKDDCALLSDLKWQAGMIDGTFDLHGSRYLVVGKEIKIAKNFYTISSLSDFKRILMECAQTGKTSVAFYCKGSSLSILQTTFYTDIYANQIMDNCGIFFGHFLRKESCKLYYSNEIEYYPGMRIAYLAQTNQFSQMTKDEKKLYDKALALAKRCKSQSSNDCELVINIRDVICADCHYQHCDQESCPGCNKDNAYGPLLYGAANCDGYADAFYLVAKLAGMNVHYQFGYRMGDTTEGHLWNIVTLQGKHYFVDITESSDESSPNLNYQTIIGADLANHQYVWNSQTAIYPLAEKTSKEHFYYYHHNVFFTSPNDAGRYIDAEKAKGNAKAMLMLKNTSTQSNNEVLKTCIDACKTGGTYYYHSIGDAIFICYIYK